MVALNLGYLGEVLDLKVLYLIIRSKTRVLDERNYYLQPILAFAFLIKKLELDERNCCYTYCYSTDPRY